MTDISFCTAIHYGNLASTKIEKNQQNIDNYFYLTGKKAIVVSTDSIQRIDHAKLASMKLSFCITLLKIVSYLTVICPLIMLLAKAINRSLLKHKVVLLDKPAVKPAENTLTSPAQLTLIAGTTNSSANTILTTTTQTVPSKPATKPHKPASGKITLAPIPTIIPPDNTTLTTPLSGGPVTPAANGTPLNSTLPTPTTKSKLTVGSFKRKVAPSPRNPQPGNPQAILKETSSLKIILEQTATGTLPKQLSWKQTLKSAKKQAEINLELEAGRGLGVKNTVQKQLDANISDILRRKVKLSPKELAARGIVLTPQDIAAGKTGLGFKWVSPPHKSNTLVFSFDDMPNVVFKIGNPKFDTAGGISYNNICSANEATTERFQNILAAKKFILDKTWDCLVLPKAQKFSVTDVEKKISIDPNTGEAVIDPETGEIEAEELKNDYVVVAEERLDFTSNIDEQKELYNDPGVLRAIMQLAEFVAELGFWDIEYRNVPILREIPGYKGLKRIGLIDLDNMKRDPENLSTGMFGVPKPFAKTPGLCVPAGVVNLVYFKEHVEAIMKIAINRGIDDIFETAQKRLKWIEEQQAAAVA